MELWMIDMLGSNAGGSHDLNMIGRNAGGSHDLEYAETQYASPQEEQVCREAAAVEASTVVKGKIRDPRILVFRTTICWWQHG